MTCGEIGAVIFLVSHPCNFFVQNFHKPADVMESGTSSVDEGVDLVLLMFFERFTVNEFLSCIFGLEWLMPPDSDFFCAGVVTALAIDMEDNVIVIGKYSEGGDIYIEDRG